MKRDSIYLKKILYMCSTQIKKELSATEFSNTVIAGPSNTEIKKLQLQISCAGPIIIPYRNSRNNEMPQNLDFDENLDVLWQ